MNIRHVIFIQLYKDLLAMSIDEHTHTQTHTHTPSLPVCVPPSLSHSLRLSICLSVCLSVSLCLSLSHTHTHTNTHTHDFAHIVFVTPQTQRASQLFLLEPLVLCWKLMQTRGKRVLDCSFMFYVCSNIAHQWLLIGVRTTSVCFYMFLSL